MAWQLEARPGAAEERGAEPTGVRNLDDQESAGRQPVEHAAGDRDWIRHVLEDMERGHHVEAGPRERRGQHVADVDLVGEPPRDRRGRSVHLDSRDPPAQGLGDGQGRARTAPDIEIAP